MLFILVPFADFQPEEERETELAHFLTHFRIRVPVIFKGQEVYVIIIEQIEPRVFNRGQLLNIGALYARKKHNPKDSSYIMHDVDMLPSDDLLEQYEIKDYEAMSFVMPTLELKKIYGFDNIPVGGGISGVRGNIFFKTNGYPNNYWGWGGEDNAYEKRLKFIGAKMGRVTHGSINHIDTIRLKGNKKEYLKEKKLKNMIVWELLREERSTWRSNGINNIQYNVIETTEKTHENMHIVHIKCKISTKGLKDAVQR